MTSLELLMGMDQEKLKEIPKKDLKINRLSELAGTDFIVTVQAVAPRRITELVDGVSGKNGVDANKAYNANVKIALAGIVEPSMKDKDLMEKFGCSTPGQLIETIFKGGEIAAIANEVMELSGMSDNAVEAVKN